MNHSSALSPRNAMEEAAALVGDGLEAAVLEPSPPTVTTEPFFADDPISPPRIVGANSQLVVPTGVAGDLTWDDWLADHPEHADWVSQRWLGGHRRLPTPPATLTATRTDLHRLAAYVVAPTRHTANGKFGLRSTLGGFGTPFFGDDRQVRVVGTQLVDQRAGDVRSAPITTLAEAASFLGTEIRCDAGAEPDSPEVGDADAPLTVDPDAANFLDAWFGMAFAGLEALRADPKSVDPARPQLWPGHFDPAIEEGDEDHRGSYGASPGDHTIDEPYLYVSVWWPDRLDIDTDDPYWNAPSFTGSILKLSDFPADTDPVLVARDFWIETRDRLTG